MTGKVKFSDIPLFGRGKSNLKYIKHRGSKLQFVNVSHELVDTFRSKKYNEIF